VLRLLGCEVSWKSQYVHPHGGSAQFWDEVRFGDQGYRMLHRGLLKCWVVVLKGCLCTAERRKMELPWEGEILI
jgi:hypothetical protein